MATTPDVQNDVLDLLRSLPTVGTPATIVVRPPDGGTQNAYAGSPKPTKDSGIPNRGVFADETGVLYDTHNDGNIRTFLVDLIITGGRNAENEVRTRANTVHDAITEHLHADGAKHGSFGPWVAPISGARYIDLRVVGRSRVDNVDDTTWQIISTEVAFDG